MKEALAVREDKKISLDNDKLLSMTDLRNKLSIGKNKLYSLVNRDDFPKIRIGKTIFVPQSELEIWLAKHLYKTLEL